MKLWEALFLILLTSVTIFFVQRQLLPSNAELDRYKQEVERLQEWNIYAENKIDSLNSRIENLHNYNDSLQSEIDNLRKSKDLVEQQRDSLLSWTDQAEPSEIVDTFNFRTEPYIEEDSVYINTGRVRNAVKIFYQYDYLELKTFLQDSEIKILQTKELNYQTMLSLHRTNEQILRESLFRTNLVVNEAGGIINRQNIEISRLQNRYKIYLGVTGAVILTAIIINL